MQRAATGEMRAVVLYDGACPLCHGAVRWLLRRDRAERLCFAPLQGETAAALRVEHPALPATITAVAALVGGRLWLGAPALFAVLALLPRPWCWLAALRVLPRPLTDGLYGLVARLRTRLFGRDPTCPLPRGVDRARLLP